MECELCKAHVSFLNEKEKSSSQKSKTWLSSSLFRKFIVGSHKKGLGMHFWPLHAIKQGVEKNLLSIIIKKGRISDHATSEKQNWPNFWPNVDFSFGGFISKTPTFVESRHLNVAVLSQTGRWKTALNSRKTDTWLEPSWNLKAGAF